MSLVQHNEGDWGNGVPLMKGGGMGLVNQELPAESIDKSASFHYTILLQIKIICSKDNE